ncbi:TPA: hypothetical protein HA235_06660 [Candidatus Woesearchaeota archaeon]|nr:hypothetical protein [Candidatus Woesearchaeota archaeon]HIH32358.1 hypothetical protein [Candidatus Woesearchaeota archaeon]HIJ14361.1 hypothetical protein [Candidatus Woesearchaeota archaeon]
MMTRFNKSILIFSLILILFFTPVSAISSDAFITYVSSIIYNDCQGKNFNVQEGFLFYTSNNQKFTGLNWPYTYDVLKNVISNLDKYTPFNDHTAGCRVAGITMSIGKDGCDILKCGNHTLDINKYDYLWDNVKIDVPLQTTNIAINNYGNLAQGLSNCNINQEQIRTELNNCTINLNQTTVNLARTETKFDWYSSVANILVSIFASAVFYLYLYKHSDEKRRKKALWAAIICFIFLIIMTFIVSRTI